jgi:acetyl esterase
VANYVTGAFPPAFVSAGNADPLLSQSLEMAKVLKAAGVRVDTLFFPDDHEPPLPHEYQFNLDTEAGQLALERSLAFLRNVFAAP